MGKASRHFITTFWIERRRMMRGRIAFSEALGDRVRGRARHLPAIKISRNF